MQFYFYQPLGICTPPNIIPHITLTIFKETTHMIGPPIKIMNDGAYRRTIDSYPMMTNPWTII
jgi:hypothetical protein